MASKAAPSCRLIVCLLTAAAVLRPGEQGALGQRRPTWPAAGRSPDCATQARVGAGRLTDSGPVGSQPRGSVPQGHTFGLGWAPQV